MVRPPARLPLLALFAVLLPMGLAGGRLLAADTPESKVIVFAAASTVDALEEIREQYRKLRPVVEIELSFEASSTAAKQIAAGAAADVFISASQDWTDFLAKKDLVVRQTNLLGNRLVVVVPKDSAIKLAEPQDLTSKKIKSLALADPDSVPAGVYARQALEKLKLWDVVRKKYAGAANVRQAMQYVETGSAEAGIVYNTDALASRKLKVAFEFDAKLSDPIRYPIVLLRTGSRSAEARRWYDYLQGADATKIFRRHGFLAGDDLRASATEP